MIFNEIWTKEVNDQYRKMIIEKKSIQEIMDYFGDKINFHPNNKFKYGGILSYQSFLNEICFKPLEINFTKQETNSLRYKDTKDIIYIFSVNNTEYVFFIEKYIENNNIFKNELVYNISFTTLKQYLDFIEKLNKIDGIVSEEEFNEIQINFERETNYGDILKIFSSISYLLLDFCKDIDKPIIVIGETKDPRKIHFYNQSIKDSFDNYELLIGDSLLYPGIKTYYYIIKK